MKVGSKRKIKKLIKKQEQEKLSKKEFHFLFPKRGGMKTLIYKRGESFQVHNFYFPPPPVKFIYTNVDICQKN